MDQHTPKQTRAAALGDLTPDQRKKLVVQSRLKARPPVFGAEDLLHGAYERWLKSDLAVEGPEETCNFLWGAINSIAFNATRHKAPCSPNNSTRSVRTIRTCRCC